MVSLTSRPDDDLREVAPTMPKPSAITKLGQPHLDKAPEAKNDDTVAEKSGTKSEKTPGKPQRMPAKAEKTPGTSAKKHPKPRQAEIVDLTDPDHPVNALDNATREMRHTSLTPHPVNQNGKRPHSNDDMFEDARMIRLEEEEAKVTRERLRRKIEESRRAFEDAARAAEEAGRALQEAQRTLKEEEALLKSRKEKMGLIFKRMSMDEIVHMFLKG